MPDLRNSTRFHDCQKFCHSDMLAKSFGQRVKGPVNHRHIAVIAKTRTHFSEDMTSKRIINKQSMQIGSCDETIG